MFESFVMQRNIMGPCWLRFVVVILMPCKMLPLSGGVVVDRPSQISTIDKDAPSSPNLTVTAISMQTMLNAKTNKQRGCVGVFGNLL